MRCSSRASGRTVELLRRSKRSTSEISPKRLVKFSFFTVPTIARFALRLEGRGLALLKGLLKAIASNGADDFARGGLDGRLIQVFAVFFQPAQVLELGAQGWALVQPFVERTFIFLHRGHPNLKTERPYDVQ
ncbi:MAG: hypothetical protein JJT96_00450 [Opitutales bacterium]|nr:hypothetical protein [Opitutales bacterium]